MSLERILTYHGGRFQVKGPRLGKWHNDAQNVLCPGVGTKQSIATMKAACKIMTTTTSIPIKNVTCESRDTAESASWRYSDARVAASANRELAERLLTKASARSVILSLLNPKRPA